MKTKEAKRVKRNIMIQVRLSEEEKESLDLTCASDGRTMSGYIRRLLLLDMARQKAEAQEDMGILSLRD